MLPDRVLYLWEWFVELSRGRGSSGFGANPLSWTDMAAWSALMGVCLERWEVTVLRALDHAFLKSLADAEDRT